MYVRKRDVRESQETDLKNRGIYHQAYTLSTDPVATARSRPENSTWRTDFELDRDRIIHSDSYRSERDKAQVHIFCPDQLMTTRLIHTEEVYQEAISVCNYMGLNAILAEAGARGHDVGHTPFGHVGEGALTDIMRKYLGDPLFEFDHAHYGVYVLEKLEREGNGLNLTAAVKDIIDNHSGGIHPGARDLPFTPEGRIVRLVDRIAYTCGDVDDAIRAGILKWGDLPQAAVRLFGPGKKQWIGTIIQAFVECSLSKEFDPDNPADFVCFEGSVQRAFDEIRVFMYENYYGKGVFEEEQAKAVRLVGLVFDDVMDKQFKDLSQEEAARRTLDVVASMTDVSILAYFNKNFIPSWPY